MNCEEFKSEMKIAIQNLFELAKKVTINNYSNNLMFIISEIKNIETDFFNQKKTNFLNNEKKTPISFDEMIMKMMKLYNEIYDINVMLYKSNDNETIIEVKYYLKKSLDEKYKEKIINHKAMIHSKIELPLNYIENEKFDINKTNFPN